MSFNKISLLVIFCLLSAISFAAIPPPPPPNNGPPCWPPPCIPIDGGISILIAAGAAFGAKKLYDSRKKSESEN